jgi:regulator of protease activity HflC (stomatin/prohibitin superfamily)
MDVMSQKRGKNVAILGAVVQLVIALVLGVVWLWLTHSLAVMAVAAFLGAGVLLWLMVAVVMYCRQLERAESLELEEIRVAAAAGTIFERSDLELRPAAVRLRWVEKWLLPVFTLLLAAAHGGLAWLLLWLLPLQGGMADVTNPAQGLLFATLLTFCAFLFGRYATGMGALREYRPLRSAGSFLLVGVLAMAATIVALGWSAWGKGETGRIDYYIAYIAPMASIIFAVEMVLNFILDLFRPRLAGQEQRLPLDSRIFELLGSPGRVGHSIAETLNYQFGFEVSKTWFYQLLSRAFIPLVVLAGLVLLALTCVVIVPEGHKGVMTHLGSLRGELEPGVHITWPWPVDSVERFDTRRIREVVLGSNGARSESARKSSQINGRDVYLWAQEHGDYNERDFIVAIPPRQQAASSPADQPPPAVNIIKLMAVVQYRISEPVKYAYKVSQAQRLLECVGEREMMGYCASATLDEVVPGSAPDRPQAIMNIGREAAGRELKARIERRVGPLELDLGVEIVNVGFVSVHPAPAAAPAYEEVLKAERLMEQQRYAAQAEANRTLGEVAGDPVAAVRLADAIAATDDLQRLRQIRDKSELLAKLSELLRANAERIAALEEEVNHQRLAGRAGDDGQGGAVLAEHRQQRELLEALRASAQAGRPLEIDKPLANARQRVDELFATVSGKPVTEIASASTWRWQYEMEQRALVQSARREMLPYQASPRVYMLDRWLDMWDEVLPGMTKYVIGVDRDRLQFWMNLETEQGVMQGATFEQK